MKFSPLPSLVRERLVLRDLSLPTRLALAAFLVSVAVGYGSALVQLHFQHATPGKALPDKEDATVAYYGQTGISQLERLLVMDEGKPFNGSGSMRNTFTTKSAGWRGAIQRKAKKENVSPHAAEDLLRKERDGERLAVLDWIRTGADQKAFEENSHVLSSQLIKHPITEEFVERESDGTVHVKIASIFEARCTRCHAEGKSTSAGNFPLEKWDQIHEYCEIESTNGGGMSLKKLAQTTHVHLLGFTMLYGLTGLIVTLTSYPGWVRGLLAPLPLVAQIVDISFWWLGRADPMFAQLVVVTGGIVAMGLGLQIVLSLFNLFGKWGKATIAAGILAAIVGGFFLHQQYLAPYLAREAATATNE